MTKYWIKKIRVSLIAISFFQMLNSCSEADQCESINCINGYCEEGTCKCEIGYEGIRCENKMVPQGIAINRITVLNYPTDGPQPWDEDGKPDIFVRIRNHVSSALIYQSDVIHEANKNERYDFIPDELVEIDLSTNFVIFELLDYDSNEEVQFIHGIICSVSPDGNDFQWEQDCSYERGERFHFFYELEYLFE